MLSCGCYSQFSWSRFSLRAYTSGGRPVLVTFSSESARRISFEPVGLNSLNFSSSESPFFFNPAPRRRACDSSMIGSMMELMSFVLLVVGSMMELMSLVLLVLLLVLLLHHLRLFRFLTTNIHRVNSWTRTNLRRIGDSSLLEYVRRMLGGCVWRLGSVVWAGRQL